MLINPQKLADSITAYSVAKEFVPTTWDTATTRIACIYKEIDELVEALEKWDGDRDALDLIRAAQFELADVAIYALLVMSHLGNENWHFRVGLQERVPAFATADRVVRPLRKYAGKALDAWRLGQKRDVLQSLEFVVVACAVMAGKFFGASIDLLVMAKLNFMWSRPARHGGKDARS
jgi:hypothetical protein